MIEIKEKNPSIGVFKVCDVLEKSTRTKIIEFVEQKKFFILIFVKDFCSVKKHKLLKNPQQSCPYQGILVIVDGNGMKNFKDTFHRSSSYVDEKYLRYKDFKKIFETDKKDQKNEIFDFWETLSVLGGLQIRGMKKIFLRKKCASQVMG